MRFIGEIAGVLVFACALFVFAGGLGMLFWWLVVAFARGFDRPAQPCPSRASDVVLSLACSAVAPAAVPGGRSLGRLRRLGRRAATIIA